MTTGRTKDLVKSLNESSQSEMQIMTSNMLISFWEKYAPLGSCRSLQIWQHNLWLNGWPESRAEQNFSIWKRREKAVKAPSLSECRKSGASCINLCNDCLLPVPLSSLWGIVNCSRHIGWTGNPSLSKWKARNWTWGFASWSSRKWTSINFFVVCALSWL